jgi:hypothetical protein
MSPDIDERAVEVSVLTHSLTHSFMIFVCVCVAGVVHHRQP